MRVAIVGAGISGLVTARLLSRCHDVTVFEAGPWAGGHTNTVTVGAGPAPLSVDTGFIVFNRRTYPNFCTLLDQLGVASVETTMSFSVSCERTGIEYNGTSLDTLFAQRRNLLRPGFLRMVRDILAFNRHGERQVAAAGEDTVEAFLDAHRYGQGFRERYLVPMGAAIWSCPPRTFLRFPVRFVMDFFRNHGMLQVHGRPVWRVVRGGSARYVEALVAPFADRVRLSTPVRRVRRTAAGVVVGTDAGAETFDEVVVACHSDQALALLEDPSPAERAVLGAFPYQANEAVLHTDATALPANRRAWAAWNYRIPAAGSDGATVTYHMNALQHLPGPEVYCVTLNDGARLDPSRVLRTLTYHHPIFTAGRDAARHRHPELIRREGLSYCGAYWGYGFHEDGVNSALAVCRAFGQDL